MAVATASKLEAVKAEPQAEVLFYSTYPFLVVQLSGETSVLRELSSGKHEREIVKGAEHVQFDKHRLVLDAEKAAQLKTRAFYGVDFIAAPELKQRLKNPATKTGAQGFISHMESKGVLGRTGIKSPDIYEELAEIKL